MRLTLRLLARFPKIPKNQDLPDRYVQKHKDFIIWKPARMFAFDQRPLRWREKEDIYYDISRPWTEDFALNNGIRVKNPKIYVQPFVFFPVFKGDRVEILVGPDKGKQGIVDYIVAERNWVCVEGLNLKHSLVGRTNDFPGFLNSETLPLLYPSEVALVDSTDKKPCSVEWREDEEGNMVRVSSRSEREIPIPKEAYSTINYKSPRLYKDEEKDTKPSLVKEKTFVPTAQTFEMSLCESHGIVEDRIPYQFYWY